MNFAYVENGALVRFLSDMPFTFKGVSGVRGLDAAAQAALGLLPLVDLTPAFDPETTRLANQAATIAVLADRVEITRATEPIPPAEVAAHAAREALRNDPTTADIRARLRTATPAELSAYVENQVTDLASARTMFKRVLFILALMSR